MHPLLEDIFVTGQFTNDDTINFSLHSFTNKSQCAFLQKLIEENKFKQSLEVGLMYGTSTLAITEAVVKNGGRHCAIDPFEKTHWNSVGLDLVKRAGYDDKLDYIEQSSYQALPKLLENNKRFDFVYIDTVKVFDWIVVDFFYVSRLLDVGGMVVFDDVNWPGIRKALRLFAQMPHFEVYAVHPFNTVQGEGRKVKLASFLNKFDRIKPMVNQELLLSDYQLGVNTICVALKKNSEDERNWDWNTSF